MKKFALLTSGSIVLLGGLFYGLSLDGQKSPEKSAPAVSGPSKPAKTAASTPSPVQTAPLDSSAESATAEPTPQADGTSDMGVEPDARQTADGQETATRNTAKRDPSKPRPTGAPSTPSEDEPAQPQATIGLRLAPDVRLPVAAMPLNFKVSPVAKKAIDQIVTDYYRELASPPPTTDPGGNASPATDPGGNASPASADTSDLIEESETGELTRIITNGPAVDAARKRADYRFKALFGNEAYNRMTINTLLEARTPVTPQK